MTNEIPLVACPFCGSLHVMPQAEHKDEELLIYITCKDCGAQGPSFHTRMGKVILADFVKSATDAWNKRALYQWAKDREKDA